VRAFERAGRLQRRASRRGGRQVGLRTNVRIGEPAAKFREQSRMSFAPVVSSCGACCLRELPLQGAGAGPGARCR